MIDLKVYFKVLDGEIRYSINRNNKTSVCSTQHIMNVSNRSVKIIGLDGKKRYDKTNEVWVYLAVG